MKKLQAFLFANPPNKVWWGVLQLSALVALGITTFSNDELIKFICLAYASLMIAAVPVGMYFFDKPAADKGDMVEISSGQERLQAGVDHAHSDIRRLIEIVQKQSADDAEKQVATLAVERLERHIVEGLLDKAIQDIVYGDYAAGLEGLKSFLAREDIPISTRKDVAVLLFYLSKDKYQTLAFYAVGLLQKWDDDPLFIYYEATLKERYGFWKESIALFESVISSARQSKSLEKRHLFRAALCSKAIALLHDNRHEEALECALESLRISEELGNIYGVANAADVSANAYKRTRQYDKALSFNQRAIRMARILGDHRLIALFIGNQGLIHKEKDRHDAALDAFWNALSFAIQENDLAVIANQFGNIATEFNKPDRFLLSLSAQFYELSWRIDERLGRRRTLAETSRCLAVIQDILGHPEKALRYAKLSNQLYNEIGDEKYEKYTLELINMISQKMANN